jgi:hypothetical protein
MFFIDKDDPWHPTLVGKPADTLGEFPMSVAYCPKLKTGIEHPRICARTDD